jgi:hypothetical protein
MDKKQLQNKMFPTGKPHISFSEIKQWKECPYRHKLVYIDKIDTFEPSPYLNFGTAVHEGCETLLETRQIDRDKILGVMKEEWQNAGYENPEWYSRQPGWYKHEPVEVWETWAHNMWNEVLDFLDKELPNWECFEAEEGLYESIDDLDISLSFKGFIDGVLKVPKKRGKGYNYWIIDWKTSGSWGWRRDKKQDLGMTAQLILYKHFWAKKHNIDLKDVRCGFILLKRGGKPGKICELVTVAVGPKTYDKGVKLMKNMISGVQKGMFLKNRNSCKYCQFYQTEHCR